MKKFITVCISLALIAAIFIIPFNGQSLLSRISGNSKTQIVTPGQMVDLPSFVKLNDIQYILSYDEGIDEGKVDKEIGIVKYSMIDETYRTPQNGDGTLPKGTKVYSIKGTDKNEAVAAKVEGSWKVYRANK